MHDVPCALEGEHALVERGGDRVRVTGGDGQGDDVAEAGVGDGEDGGVESRWRG